MSWYLFYNYGSCNYGDHYCDLEEFATYDLALTRANEIRLRDLDATITIIEGRVLL